jgi:hypothetical protein
VVIRIKVHVYGVMIAVVFSVLGAIFVMMSGYGEFVYLIILLWILIPVVIAKLYQRKQE